jgi:hypothetical protein
MDEKYGRFQIAILLYPGVTALDAVGSMPNTDVRQARFDEALRIR